MKDITVGIDIGGTNTAIGIVDTEGNCLKKGSIPTNTKQAPEAYAQEVAEAIKKMLAEDSSLNLLGIGIGAPNGNFHRGTIEFAPNLDFEGIVPLTVLMKKHFNVPVLLTNDANAAALGENMYGGAKGMKDFIMITLGTGVGSGIVSNGEMIYGYDGFAGELGHTVSVANGRQCNCGKKGCLETYCSATGMTRTVAELMAKSNKASSLRDIPFNEITAKIIYDEAVKGDSIALETFDITAKILGESLSNFVAFSRPEAIFIFGGVTNAGDMLFKPLKKYFNETLMTIFKDKVDIRISELEAGNAAIVGASALVLSSLK